MSFQIRDGQGQQAVDMKQVFDQHTGNSVVEGIEPSYATGLEVEVSQGVAIVNNNRVQVSSQSVTLDSADPSQPRKDLITVDETGSLTVYKGTPEERRPESQDIFQLQRPAPPDLTGVEEPIIAEVFISEGVTNLSDSVIRDRRSFSDVIAEAVSIFSQPQNQQDAVSKLYSDSQFSLQESSILLGPDEGLTLDRFTIPSGKVIQITAGSVGGQYGELELYNHTDGTTEYVFEGEEIDVGDPLYSGSEGDDVEIRLVNVSDTNSAELTCKISYNIIEA